MTIKIRQSLLCAASIALLGAHTTFASERSAELINSFTIFCLTETPDFESMNAKATAMKLPVVQEMGAPREKGDFVHLKSWAVPLKDGAHYLGFSEARGPKGEQVSCSIAASDVSNEDIKQDLLKSFTLGTPRETTMPNGWKAMTWDIPKLKVVIAAPDGKRTFESDNIKLMLTDHMPPNSPGIFLNMIRQVTPAP